MTSKREKGRPPIAVVGVSALFPGSVDSRGFWSDILAGTDRITDVPPSHWLIDDYFDADPATPDKTYGRRGGFLGPVDFDVMGFGVPPNVVPSTDTAQLLALIVAQRVLDDATRTQFSDLDRSRVSVILGVTSGQELLGAMASRMNRPMWLQGMRRAGVPEDVAQAACAQIADLHPSWTEDTFPGLLGNVVAGRIANRLDLGGTNCVTDAACASSFSAISMGVNELYLGDSDMVIAGGVDTMNDILMYMCFSKTPALSRTEDIRPFSADADGTMLGEGIGMVALKRLDDAERDGNSIYCVITGVGASSDGRSKSVYAPVSSGQARALDNAYAKAGYGPDTVELVEAHGTGTVAGDAAEFGGLEMVFDASGRADRQWCALGSVKSQIGHTKAAAGAAGLFKIVMALHHGVLPQTAKIDRPNAGLDLKHSPFHLNTRTRPWVRSADHERRGSVSSFGFGGSNFHIAMAEYVGPGNRAPRLRTSDAELVVLTGTDAHGVVALARTHLAAATAPGYLSWLAQSSQRSYRSDDAARLAIVAGDEADLRDKLAAAIGRIDAAPMTDFAAPNGIHYGTGTQRGAVALLFPGQGSQYPFMGADLAMQHRQAMAAWDTAADLEWDDKPLHDVVFPITSFDDNGDAADAALLTATQWAQPAIGATSLSMLRVLRSIGVTPAFVAGHSFGEITALHAAGVLSEADMIAVARRRGELMAEAVQTPGSMTAVSASIDMVRAVLASSIADVVVANHNSHNQVVLSGRTEAIERIETELAERRIACKRLPVATAFHSEVVSGASGAFARFLETVDFAPPAVPVFANATAVAYPADPLAARVQLGRQLAEPVRFVELIEAMHDAGARTFVEVGPSSILTNLVDSILDGRDHRAVALDRRGKPGLGAFLGGLAQLVAAGVPMQLDAMWSEYGEMPNPHDAPTPKLTIPVSGTNNGKPYPPHDLSELVGANPVTPEPSRVESAVAAVAPATPPAPVPATATPSAAVLAAYQSMQQQTAEAHTAYLASMAQVHSAYLATAQQSLAVLGQLAGVAIPTMQPVVLPIAATSSPIAPVQTMAPAPVAAPVAPVVAPVAPVFTPPAQPVAPVVLAAPVAVAPPVAVAVPALSFDELRTLLLAVVADRTGYPPEMLSMEMELESDLGIDSIKRVEILSAMHDAVPNLPDVDTRVLASLSTLGQIVEHLGHQSSAGAAPIVDAAIDAAATAPPAHASVGVDSGRSPAELRALLLQVVADKTGYPAEMLSMEMELESDLGIDSIRRVEIFSAMHDALPDIAELDTTVMASLVTLGQIADHLGGHTDDGPSDTTPSASPTDADWRGRFVLRTEPSPSSGAEITGLRRGRIAVTDDGSGVADELVAFLVGEGVDAAITADPAALAGSVGVICLGGLRDVACIADAIAVNRDAFRAARALASRAELFVTVSALGGSFGLDVVDPVDPSRAWTGGLVALARTASIEWPAAGVRAIDIEITSGATRRTPTEIATAIGNELLRGTQQLEVGLRADGTRLTLVNTPCPVEHGSMPVGPDDVIVVAGGGRGVTAACMVELAGAAKSRFVLLGRTALADEPASCRAAGDDAALKRVLLDSAAADGRQLSPAELGRMSAAVLANREIHATMSAIEQAGGEARYVTVDITDSDAVAAAMAEVRADMGPITAVIHGAGVLADKLIADKTDRQFDTVFGTKVLGLDALLAATADDPLVLLCLFSSVAASAGNAGQSDYAMANEVLNTVAVAEAARRGPGCVVKSIGWGPWDGGMVAPALKAHFQSMGVGVIPLAEGARLFVDEIAGAQSDQVDVVIGAAAMVATARAMAVDRVDA